MDDKNLIDLMVQETIQGEAPSNVIPFQNENTFQISAIYQPERKCYQISKKNEVLEIPKNWGPFRNRISQSFTLTPFEDSDDFLSVLEMFYGRDINSAQITLINSSTEVFFGQAS